MGQNSSTHVSVQKTMEPGSENRTQNQHSEEELTTDHSEEDSTCFTNLDKLDQNEKREEHLESKAPKEVKNLTTSSTEKSRQIISCQNGKEIPRRRNRKDLPESKASKEVKNLTSSTEKSDQFFSAHNKIEIPRRRNRRELLESEASSGDMENNRMTGVTCKQHLETELHRKIGELNSALIINTQKLMCCEDYMRMLTRYSRLLPDEEIIVELKDKATETEPIMRQKHQNWEDLKALTDAKFSQLFEACDLVQNRLKNLEEIYINQKQATEVLDRKIRDARKRLEEERSMLEEKENLLEKNG